MLLVIVSVVLLVAHSSDACSCYQQHLQTVLCTANTLVKVEVIEEIDKGIDFHDWRNQKHTREYRARVEKVFNGEVPEAEIVIHTASNPALCGTQLTTDSWLLELDLYNGKYQASLCKLHRRWDYDIEDDLMRDLMQGTLDCDCQPATRYSPSRCCNDFQDTWSVHLCSSHFGKCQMQPGSGTCGWEVDYDYNNCLNEYGFHVNEDLCVARKPCPESAEYKFSMFEQVTCEDHVARRLSWGKETCMCPDDKPYLNTQSNKCVTGMECPRGVPIEEPKETGGIVAELDTMISCPSNQLYYGKNKCLPCLQTCGSTLAWCTRICITNECGCPEDKPVLVLDTCYTQEECENIPEDVDEEEETTDEAPSETYQTPEPATSTSQYQFQSSPATVESSSEYDYKSSPPTEDTTPSPTIDLTSPPTEVIVTEIDVKTSASAEATTSEIKIETSPPTETISTEMAKPSTTSDLPTSPSTEATTEYDQEETNPPTETSSTPGCIGLACLPVEETTTEMGDADPTSEKTTSQLEVQTSPTTEGSTTEYQEETSPTTEGSTTEYQEETSPATEGSTTEYQEETSPTTEGSTTEYQEETSPTTEGSTTEYQEETSPTTEGSTTEYQEKTSPPSETTSTPDCIGIACLSTDEVTTEMGEASPSTEATTSQFEVETSPTTEMQTSPPTQDSSSTPDCIGLACLSTDEVTTEMGEASPSTEATTSQFEIETSPTTEGSASPDTDSSSSPGCIGMACLSTDEASTERFESSSSPDTDEASTEAAISSTSADTLIQCDETKNFVFNECASSCVKTCDESCDIEGHVAHDDTFLSINFGDECFKKCECREGYVRHEGMCIPAELCPDYRTLCQRQLDDVISVFNVEGHEFVPDLRFCDEEGNYLAKQCVGLDKCTCVDRNGISVLKDGFYFSETLFDCDFDEGIVCYDGKVFEDCRSPEKLCNLLDHPQEEKCMPGCSCPDEKPYSQGGMCVDESACVPLRYHEEAVQSFFTEWSLNMSGLGVNPETCLNSNPTCEQWATRGLCGNGYLIRNCKKACNLCEVEEMELKCQGMRDTLQAFLEDNILFGVPDIVCLEDDADSYFPRQCVGSVCHCVSKEGVTEPSLSHSITHPFQCPGSPECPAGQLYTNCAVQRTCDGNVTMEMECMQGCGCHPETPVYVANGEEEPFCATHRDACPEQYPIHVFEDVECYRAAEEAAIKMRPVPTCDLDNPRLYQPKQCGEEACFCVTKEGVIEVENVSDDYLCLDMSEREECTGGKVYTTCDSWCPLTCENVLNPWERPCIGDCMNGCKCPTNMVENSEGECVDNAFQCPGFEDDLPTDCDDRVTLFEELGLQDFKPSCGNDGLYQYEQCQNTMCHCVNPMNGQKLEGSEQHMSDSDIDCEFIYLEQLADCQGGTVFTMCGSDCGPSCDNLDPVCDTGCVERCQCPDEKPIYDEESSTCISVSECPVETTPTPPATSSSSPHESDYHFCHTRDSWCYCYNEEGNVIPDSTRNLTTFFNEIGVTPTGYCEYRRGLADGRPCALLQKGEVSPTCTDDGMFAPLQCDGDLCYCVDEHGSRDIGVDSEEEEMFEGAEDPRAMDICMEAIRKRYEVRPCLVERLKAHKASNDMMVGVFQPNCQSDGRYGAGQCRGSDCYCVDHEGEEIPDTRYERGDNDDTYCEGVRTGIMSKKCNLDREYALNNDNDYVPTCSILGDFHAKQCTETGCFCAETIFGRMLPDTDHEQEEDLDCDEIVEMLFKTVCYVNMMADMKKAMQGEVEVHIRMCDVEGHYYHTQCDDNSCYCADKYGNELSESRKDVSMSGDGFDSFKEICQERRFLLESSACYQQQEAGETVNCNDYGDFLAVQCIENSHCYCVDLEGMTIFESDMEIPDFGFCENFREIYAQSECYMAKNDGSTVFGDMLDCNSSDGSFLLSQCMDNDTCLCVNSETGVVLENTYHTAYENEVCGTRSDPFVLCPDKVASSSTFKDLVCTETGMYYEQWCSASYSCVCIDKWMEEVTDSHHKITEHACFQETWENLQSETTGAPCEKARTISSQIHGEMTGLYIPECTEEGLFFPRQCHGDVCFCVHTDGSYLDDTEHQRDYEFECRDVVLHIRGPKPQYSSVGEGSSITCSIAAGYPDGDFVMYVNADLSDAIPDISVWSNAQFMRTTYDLGNGTVETSIEGFVDEFTAEHNNTEILCVSLKHNKQISMEILIQPEVVTIPPTTSAVPTTAEPTTAQPTTVEPTTAEPTTETPPIYIRICNEKRGCVYSESPDRVIASTNVVEGDTKGLFEYMDDMTIRSAAFPDQYLTQALVSGQISIKLKPYKGNAVQTWLKNTDSEGDSRIYVFRPSKGKRTPYYLDYFKKELTGYKATEKLNQKWDFLLETGEPFTS